MTNPLPDIPGLPDTCQLDRVIGDFIDAVNAYERRDADAVAAALAPAELGEVETYTRLVGLTMLAAAACGAEYRKTHSPNPFGFYGVRIENSAGEAVNPDDSVEAANTVAAARMVTAALNSDHDMIDALIRAHMPFDGSIERGGVLLDLLAMYCALRGAEADR